MDTASGGFSEIWILVIIIALSIGSWALCRHYREEYGTTEMSRFRGFGLLFGLLLVVVGTATMCQYILEPTSEPAMEYMLGCGGIVAGGTLLSVLCCMGILRRYSGREAAAMILRLFVVGFATYMVAAWIMTALFFWLFAKLFPRKKYVVVEVD